MRELLAGVSLKAAAPESLLDREIRGLDYDSRRIGGDSVFFAIRGSRADGAQFAGEAAGKGAVAVISESPAPGGFAVPWLEVDHVRRALALMSRNFYRRVAEKVSLTGITGTNGKSTTAMLIDSVLRMAGFTTGLIGTIEYRLAGERLEAVN
ncbi:MAG: Mur ligase domain-containing protein, partial [Bryobacteraceae bacterium]